MKLTQIRIKNYRSINDEVSLNFGGRTTIVGPNNSGKTNIVNAIQAFFSGVEENSYEISRDLPTGFAGKQTSIIASFEVDANADSGFLRTYSEAMDCLEVPKRVENIFQLFLYYSTTGKPVYQFFPNGKIKSKLSQRFRHQHNEAVRHVLNAFVCKNIPSVKDPEALFAALLLPYIKRSIAVVLEPHLPKIKRRLDEIADSINQVFKIGRLANISTALDVAGTIENTLSSFDFLLDDGIRMHARAKGSGLQAATILSSLKWIGAEERSRGRETIWLLEEPESYLHPELAKSCSLIIDDLSSSNTVVVTTHAVSFVGQNPIYIFETSASDTGTNIKQCRTYSEATASIRKALGLRYSDFFQLGRVSLLVEGVSDREILKWALHQIKPKKGNNELPLVRSATIMDFTGVTSLKDFLKHSYDFIRLEAATFTIFDGDEAGVDAANALNRYFSNKSIPFSVNKDYAVLPRGFPIEGLFPSAFISEMHEKHPTWFSVYNADINGTVLAFSIKDGSKSSMQNALMARAEEETTRAGNFFWAKDFIKLFALAETELNKKLRELEPSYQ